MNLAAQQVDDSKPKATDEQKLALRARLAADFPFYAERCLKIRPKAGGLIPFMLNKVQRELHRRLEDQIARTGRVRAIILKARQPGCSTYVQARFFHMVSHNKGRRAFILTHRMDATDNLFGMATRFLANLPDQMRPHVGTESAKELQFDKLDSGYAVSTAGSKGAGRSHTIQYFHASEMAHWENAEEHFTGAFQAVPDLSGTEVIVESTANGIGGLFYDLCKAAERGEGVYELIFIPWHFHDEYTKAPPPDWKAPPEIAAYGALHGLTRAQLHWAFAKNMELAIAAHEPTDKICAKFRQEYPATADEAFNVGTDRPFISPDLVIKARKFRVPLAEIGYHDIILGVDVARGGRARTKVIDRQGRVAGSHVNDSYNSANIIDTAEWLIGIIRRVEPKIVNIDATGIGGAVYDYLCNRGFNSPFGRLSAINFGGAATDDRRYFNKRAEMYDKLLEWLASVIGVQIPDDDVLHTELCAAIWGGPGKTRYENGDRLIIEAKEHIYERLKVTMDDSDALALTFARDIAPWSAEDRRKVEEHYKRKARSIF